MPAPFQPGPDALVGGAGSEGAGIAADVAEVGILEFELGSRDRSTGRLV